MKLKLKEHSTLPLNNRGQTLVTFLLLLPLFFIIIVSVLELGSLSIQKRKIINSVHQALVYASQNQENDTLEDQVSVLLGRNIDNIVSLTTVKEKEYFKIELTCELEGIFENIFAKYYSYTISKKIIYQ